MEYCNHFQTVEKMNEINTPFKSEELDEIVTQKWYSDWANNLTLTQMFGLIEAANSLDIPELLNLMTLVWASVYKWNTCVAGKCRGWCRDERRIGNCIILFGAQIDSFDLVTFLNCLIPQKGSHQWWSTNSGTSINVNKTTNSAINKSNLQLLLFSRNK